MAHQCNYCEMSFGTKTDLIIHMHTHTGTMPHKCSVCEKPFSSKHSRDRHMITHTGEKSFACTMCDKSFSSKGNLLNHHRVHTGEKPYPCQECGKCFGNKIDLVYHTRTHTGEMPHSCDVCHKAFRVKSNLTRHMRIHTGERPHRCEVCSMSFSEKSNLARHRKTHMTFSMKRQRKEYAEGERRHVCEICSSCFSKRGNLVRHMVIHNEEKPFICGICDIMFMEKRSFNRHNIAVHSEHPQHLGNEGGVPFTDKDNITTVAPLSSQAGQIDTSIQETRHTCILCDESFADERILSMHLLLHANEHSMEGNLSLINKTVNTDSHQRSPSNELGDMSKATANTIHSGETTLAKKITDIVFPGKTHIKSDTTWQTPNSINSKVYVDDSSSAQSRYMYSNTKPQVFTGNEFKVNTHTDTNMIKQEQIRPPRTEVGEASLSERTHINIKQETPKSSVATSCNNFPVEREKTQMYMNRENESSGTKVGEMRFLERTHINIKQETPESSVATTNFPLEREKTQMYMNRENESAQIEVGEVRCLERTHVNIKQETPESSVAVDNFPVDREKTPMYMNHENESTGTEVGEMRFSERKHVKIKQELPWNSVATTNVPVETEMKLNSKQGPFTSDIHDSSFHEPANMYINIKPELLNIVNSRSFADEPRIGIHTQHMRTGSDVVDSSYSENSHMYEHFKNRQTRNVGGVERDTEYSEMTPIHTDEEQFSSDDSSVEEPEHMYVDIKPELLDGHAFGDTHKHCDNEQYSDSDDLDSSHEEPMHMYVDIKHELLVGDELVDKDNNCDTKEQDSDGEDLSVEEPMHMYVDINPELLAAAHKHCETKEQDINNDGEDSSFEKPLQMYVDIKPELLDGDDFADTYKNCDTKEVHNDSDSEDSVVEAPTHMFIDINHKLFSSQGTADNTHVNVYNEQESHSSEVGNT